MFHRLPPTNATLSSASPANNSTSSSGSTPTVPVQAGTSSPPRVQRSSGLSLLKVLVPPPRPAEVALKQVLNTPGLDGHIADYMGVPRLNGRQRGEEGHGANTGDRLHWAEHALKGKALRLTHDRESEVPVDEKCSTHSRHPFGSTLGADANIALAADDHRFKLHGFKGKLLGSTLFGDEKSPSPAATAVVRGTQALSVATTDSKHSYTWEDGETVAVEGGWGVNPKILIGEKAGGIWPGVLESKHLAEAAKRHSSFLSKQTNNGMPHMFVIQDYDGKSVIARSLASDLERQQGKPAWNMHTFAAPAGDFAYLNPYDNTDRAEHRSRLADANEGDIQYMAGYPVMCLGPAPSLPEGLIRVFCPESQGPDACRRLKALHALPQQEPKRIAVSSDLLTPFLRGPHIKDGANIGIPGWEIAIEVPPKQVASSTHPAKQTVSTVPDGTGRHVRLSGLLAPKVPLIVVSTATTTQGTTQSTLVYCRAEQELPARYAKYRVPSQDPAEWMYAVPASLLVQAKG